MPTFRQSGVNRTCTPLSLGGVYFGVLEGVGATWKSVIALEPELIGAFLSMETLSDEW